jgi:hypothetical protein
MVENNAKVNYSDLIELGFKKINCSSDAVFLSQYGYPYFFLAYGEEGDQVTLEWSPIDRNVNLYLNSHTYQSGLSLSEVKKIVNMLKDDVWENISAAINNITPENE